MAEQEELLVLWALVEKQQQELARKDQAIEAQKAQFAKKGEEEETGFQNVYQDIRDKLIEKGVSEKEIAFIHKANMETRKAELFAKVRSGQVVSAKYSCGFSISLVSSIIVGEKYLDYFTTITEDRL